MNLRDCGGFTALHRACQKSFAHVAETLLRQGRANPQIKCPFSGNTALHEAAMLGHADCVNCLLRFHAAPWARNSELEMPFELALRYGFAELANALAGYQPSPPLTTQVAFHIRLCIYFALSSSIVLTFSCSLLNRRISIRSILVQRLYNISLQRFLVSPILLNCVFSSGALVSSAVL